MPPKLTNNSRMVTVAIGIIWLFHISGVVGISIGYDTWFIQQTPLNLVVSLLLFLIFYPIDSGFKIGLFLLFFLIGLFAEWLGITYGVLFGDYYYGDNLGPKLDGVPFLIGTYWAILVFITAPIAKIIVKKHSFLQPVLGSILMVFLDVLMERSAPVFDFWYFTDGLTLRNYITWFVLGYIIHLILQKSKVTAENQVPIHLYLAQLVFFGYFFFFTI